MDAGHSTGAAACFCPASSCSHISGNAFEVWSPFLPLLGLVGLLRPTPNWWDQPGWSPTQASAAASCSCPQRPLRADLGPFPLLSPSLCEGEARPAPTAADPRNSGNKGVRNQIRLGTLEPKVSGTLIASVSTDGGPPKYSPGCCQDYTSVGTSPSRLLVFPGLYPYTLPITPPLCLTYIFTRVHAQRQRQPPSAPLPTVCMQESSIL